MSRELAVRGPLGDTTVGPSRYAVPVHGDATKFPVVPLSEHAARVPMVLSSRAGAGGAEGSCPRQLGFRGTGRGEHGSLTALAYGSAA